MKTTTPARTVLLRTITAAGILILLLILWRQQSLLTRLEELNTKLQDQNLELQHTSTATSALPQTATTSGTLTQAVDSTAPATPPGPAQPVRNRLIFTGTDVQQTATGLVATLRFKAAHTGPLGLVLMSVRLPHNIAATIQSIQPVGPAKYEEGEGSVSDNGRFAMFQGTLGDEKEVAIALGFSGSARAFIKGSCGIPAMDLDIQPTNATATPLGR